MQIELEQTDIDTSDGYMSIGNCLLCRTVKRLFPELTNVSAGGYHIDVKDKDEHIRYRFSELDGDKIMFAYNNNETKFPFTIELVEE